MSSLDDVNSILRFPRMQVPRQTLRAAEHRLFYDLLPQTDGRIIAGITNLVKEAGNLGWVLDMEWERENEDDEGELWGGRKQVWDDDGNHGHGCGRDSDRGSDDDDDLGRDSDSDADNNSLDTGHGNVRRGFSPLRQPFSVPGELNLDDDGHEDPPRGSVAWARLSAEKRTMTGGLQVSSPHNLPKEPTTALLTHRFEQNTFLRPLANLRCSYERAQFQTLRQLTRYAMLDRFTYWSLARLEIRLETRLQLRLAEGDDGTITNTKKTTGPSPSPALETIGELWAMKLEVGNMAREVLERRKPPRGNGIVEEEEEEKGGNVSSDSDSGSGVGSETRGRGRIRRGSDPGPGPDSGSSRKSRTRTSTDTNTDTATGTTPGKSASTGTDTGKRSSTGTNPGPDAETGRWVSRVIGPLPRVRKNSTAKWDNGRELIPEGMAKALDKGKGKEKAGTY